MQYEILPLIAVYRISEEHCTMQCVCVCVCSVAQLVTVFCDPMDCSPSGFSVHEIFQARRLEWVAISFSRGSLLCSSLSPGIRWVLSTEKKSCSGLANSLNQVFSLSGSLLDFVYSFSTGSIDVRVIQTPGHLVKAKDRKQGWSIFPTKDIYFSNRYQWI